MVTTQASNKSPGNPEGYVFLPGAIDGLADDIPKLMEAWLSPIGINNIVVNDAPVSPDPGFVECEVIFEIPRYGSTQGYALGTFANGEPPASFQVLAAPAIGERIVGLTTITAESPVNKFFYENFKPNGFLQLMINDTAYFQEPTHTQALGISGDAAPFPAGRFQGASVVAETQLLRSPGQTWDLKYTVMNDIPALNDYIIATHGEEGGQIGNNWVFSEAFASYYSSRVPTP